MNRKHQCPRCFQSFSSLQRLDSHLHRKIKCEKINIDNLGVQLQVEKKTPTRDGLNLIKDISFSKSKKHSQELEKEYIPETFDFSAEKRYECEHCGIRFTRRDNMISHQNRSCKVFKQLNPLTVITQPKTVQPNPLENKVSMLEEKLAKLTETVADKPNIINNISNQNILQFVCVGQNDNYLDMLTEHLGFNKALDFIKECALSNILGDCKLIEKIYFTNANPSIRYADQSRTNIEYFDENRNSVIDNKGLKLGKRLANNLQNSYLKGVNHLIKVDSHDPIQSLAEYDLHMWNHHIYELSDSRYQKKIINQLNIPYKNREPLGL
jgi:ribosomal protein L37AE/L43A